MLRISVVFTCFLFLTALSGCQSAANKTAGNYSASSGQARPDLTARQRSELYQAILAAEIAEGNNNNEVALTQYLYALSILPDPEIAADAIVLAQQTQDPAALIQASNAWLEADPKNLKAIEANILGQLMQFDQANDLRAASLENALEKVNWLIKSYPDDQIAYRELSALNRLYLQSSTLSLWQTLIQQERDRALSWSLIADAYLRASRVSDDNNFLNNAEQAVDVALRLDDTFAPAVRLKVNWLTLSNQTNRIAPFLETLILANDKNSAAYEALAQLYYRQKDYARALKLADRWLETTPNQAEALYIKAASHYGLRDFDSAHSLFVELLDTDYTADLALFYCGDTGERVGKINQAMACYRNVEMGNYWYLSQQRLSYLLISQDQTEQALERLDNFALNSLSPEQVEQAVSLKSDLLVELDRQLEAVDWLAKFIDENRQTIQVPVKHFRALFQVSPDNDWMEYAVSIEQRLSPKLRSDWLTRIASELAEKGKVEVAIELLNQKINTSDSNFDYRYSRALLRDYTKQYDLMEQELRQLLKEDDDNPHIQNALGYTLADQNKNLEEALALVKQAQTKLPSSGAVMDSLGWVNYRMGNIEKAEAILKTALQLDFSGEVLAHYLEVLIQNKKRQQAEELLAEYWLRVDSNRFVLALLEKFKMAKPSVEANIVDPLAEPSS
ncbi:MAG: tetratricopeptide repeat protein [Gammaproteobacteria bacterium]|nr:tetratricopeptide repeat protein [Gammaproteobacteria bacterium]